MRQRNADGFGCPKWLSLCGFLLWSTAAWGAQLSVGSTQALAGAAGVVLPVRLTSEADENVASFQCDLMFDASAFTIDSVTAGAAAQDAGKDAVRSNLGPGLVRVIVSGFNQNVIADGVVVELSISVDGAAPDGFYAFTLSNVILSDPNAQPVSATAVPGGVQVGDLPVHSADQDGNYQISFSELLRVIQLFNATAVHCDAGTEDGYALGPGDQSCARHSSDFRSPEWSLDISELLRLIQFYNLLGYEPAEDTEDGFRAVSKR
jgi:hypothetical protein